MISHIKKTSDWIAGVYGSLAIIVSVTIGGYAGYISIIDSIEENTKQIEVTQIMMLKDIVRKAEHNPCLVGDSEWDDYIANYTTLHTLKIKYKKIGVNAPWQPIERLKVRGTECLK